MKIMNPYPDDLRAITTPGRRSCVQAALVDRATDRKSLSINATAMAARKEEAPGASNTEGW